MYAFLLELFDALNGGLAGVAETFASIDVGRDVDDAEVVGADGVMQAILRRCRLTGRSPQGVAHWVQKESTPFHALKDVVVLKRSMCDVVSVQDGPRCPCLCGMWPCKSGALSSSQLACVEVVTMAVTSALSAVVRHFVEWLGDEDVDDDVLMPSVLERVVNVIESRLALTLVLHFSRLPDRNRWMYATSGRMAGVSSENTAHRADGGNKGDDILDLSNSSDGCGEAADVESEATVSDEQRDPAPGSSAVSSNVVNCPMILSVNGMPDHKDKPEIILNGMLGAGETSSSAPAANKAKVSVPTLEPVQCPTDLLWSSAIVSREGLDALKLKCGNLFVESLRTSFAVFRDNVTQTVQRLRHTVVFEKAVFLDDNDFLSWLCLASGTSPRCYDDLGEATLRSVVLDRSKLGRLIGADGLCRVLNIEQAAMHGVLRAASGVHVSEVLGDVADLATDVRGASVLLCDWFSSFLTSGHSHDVVDDIGDVAIPAPPENISPRAEVGIGMGVSSSGSQERSSGFSTSGSLNSGGVSRRSRRMMGRATSLGGSMRLGREEGTSRADPMSGTGGHQPDVSHTGSGGRRSLASLSSTVWQGVLRRRSMSDIIVFCDVFGQAVQSLLPLLNEPPRYKSAVPCISRSTLNGIALPAVAPWDWLSLLNQSFILGSHRMAVALAMERKLIVHFRVMPTFAAMCGVPTGSSPRPAVAAAAGNDGNGQQPDRTASLPPAGANKHHKETVAPPRVGERVDDMAAVRQALNVFLGGGALGACRQDGLSVLLTCMLGLVPANVPDWAWEHDDVHHVAWLENAILLWSLIRHWSLSIGAVVTLLYVAAQDASRTKMMALRRFQALSQLLDARDRESVVNEPNGRDVVAPHARRAVSANEVLASSRLFELYELLDIMTGLLCSRIRSFVEDGFLGGSFSLLALVKPALGRAVQGEDVMLVLATLSEACLALACISRHMGFEKQRVVDLSVLVSRVMSTRALPFCWRSSSTVTFDTFSSKFLRMFDAPPAFLQHVLNVFAGSGPSTASVVSPLGVVMPALIDSVAVSHPLELFVAAVGSAWFCVCYW